MSEEYPPIPRVHPVMAAMATGALWGALGYAVLWGLSPIVVGRRFVVSLLGTLVFLPVRLVLWGIRAVEAAAGRSFELADSTWWIGVTAALVGAVIAAAAALALRPVVRRLRS